MTRPKPGSSPAGPPRRGRRPGTSETRAAILASARELFAASGFAGTTIRAVAAGAGVDAALVHHYFGSKDDLFFAALEIPLDPRATILPAVTGGSLEDAAERLLRTFLSVWDDPVLRLPLLGVVRAALEPTGHRLFVEGFLPLVLQPVGEALGIDRPHDRMALVASQAMGLILLRYVFELEPLASMPAEQVVATYAPTLQRYLTGVLP